MKQPTRQHLRNGAESPRPGFPHGEVLSERIIKTGEKLTIRRWQPKDDANRMFELHLRSMKSNPGYVYLATGWDNDLLDIENHYMKGRNDFLVAEIDKCIVGFSGFKEREDLGQNVAEFVRERIEPRCFGNGIGTEMDRIRFELARKRGFEKAYGETSGFQKSRIHNFEKEGWTRLEDRETDWSKSHNTTILCYEKKL